MMYNGFMNERLIAYLSNHLTPINFVEEYHQKRLPISILFSKMVKTFPKEKIGNFKASYKHLFLDKQKYLENILTKEEINLIVKNQNNYRPKNGQYVEFLFLSFLNTVIKNDSLVFANIEEDISQGWDFKINNELFDISTNPNKITKNGVILLHLDEAKILDKNGLILDDIVLYFQEISRKHKIETTENLLDFSNTIINKIRLKYIELYNHKVIKQDSVKNVNVIKSSNNEFEVPLLGNLELPTQTIDLKQMNYSLDSIEILSKIEQLSSADKQTILLIINQLNSKPLK